MNKIFAQQQVIIKEKNLNTHTDNLSSPIPSHTLSLPVIPQLAYILGMLREKAKGGHVYHICEQYQTMPDNMGQNFSLSNTL